MHFPESNALSWTSRHAAWQVRPFFSPGSFNTTRGRSWYLTQIWARNYAEEAALIAAFWVKSFAVNRVLVTFNGKSFDWPQVRDRTTRYVAVAGTLPELIHFDLLHHARRHYGNRFNDCRLQTLERHLLGRVRSGDIPGREIPGVYAEYVRTANERLVEPILHHNAVDLITLWQLALLLSADRD